MKKLSILAAVAAAGFGVWLALQPQLRYAKIVLELSRLETLVVPVEGDYAAALAAAAKEGKRVQDVAPPAFVYAVVTHGGRDLAVCPAYTEKEAPAGTVMTMGLMRFLRLAADDPKAEGIAVNPSVANAFFTVTVDKPTLLRIIESLRRRGFKE